jgi:hypothetical protein
MLYSSFAGTLGANPLPPDVKEFLNQVRKRPQDFKKLLLTVVFHPDPTNTLTVKPALIDMILMNGIRPIDLLNPLRRLSHGKLKPEIEAELQLRNEMIKTTGDLGPEKLKPFLLEPVLWEFSPDRLKFVASFAQRMLPPRLAQRIINSEASEAHLTNLAGFLRRYAEVLQTKDAAFKALVDREQKRRQQEKQEQERRAREEEERKKRQQRGRRR